MLGRDTSFPTVQLQFPPLGSLSERKGLRSGRKITSRLCGEKQQQQKNELLCEILVKTKQIK